MTTYEDHQRELAELAPTLKPRTEFLDGIEFEIPTWDKTPVSWNKSGFWAKDEEIAQRCLESIRTAIPNENDLLAESRTAVDVERSNLPGCHTYWGSHGCGRENGYPGLCVCDPVTDDNGEFACCSALLKFGESDAAIMWWNADLRLSSLKWTWFS